MKLLKVKDNDYLNVEKTVNLVVLDGDMDKIRHYDNIKEKQIRQYKRKCHILEILSE
jgi:hypothetical protein